MKKVNASLKLVENNSLLKEKTYASTFKKIIKLFGNANKVFLIRQIEENDKQ